MSLEVARGWSEALRARVFGAIEVLTGNPEIARALGEAPPEIAESLPVVFAASEFVRQSCLSEPALLTDLLAHDGLRSRWSLDDISLAAADAAASSSASSANDSGHLIALRRWRRRELTRIAWRDLAGWATLEQTLADLTAFADGAIRTAVEWARGELIARYGEPRSAAGEVQPLVVLAMGKLGGAELNYSSDVDLVLLFPEHGETDGARPIENEEFFARLARALSRLLELPTAEGFVLRVDLRLRPFGESGAPVSSFAAFEDYLPRHGRDWERYAYVKARPVTGAQAYAALDAAAVRPFVYRRYLDFGVFESLREMKALIAREVERRELADDIKLGPGGIREIEFIVQAFQLIRGGRDRRLQTPSLFAALAVLEETQSLPSGVVADLDAAYRCLRRLENRLQMLEDRQVHSLPQDAGEQERIAIGMGSDGWSELTAQLDAHRARVARHFEALILGAARADAASLRIDLGRFWDSRAETAALVESLAAAGFAPAEEAVRLLLELRASSLVRRLDEPGRRRLQALLPVLLREIAASPQPTIVLRRILGIVEAIGQRSTYFALLLESAAARSRLVEICGHGDFLARQIAVFPLLLDELIDARLSSEVPDRAALARELGVRLQQVPQDDPEREVEALRDFQRVAVFRVTVADLSGRLALMRVSDRLTDIAELIVARAMELAWEQMTAQFGVPHCGAGDGRRRVRIAAAGYGKLGGRELGYGSDLDLVFLHDSDGERQETNGAKPIDNQVFFVRLAQRIVHLLTMHSAAGRLYEVDVRLRPSGKGGMLLTSIRAFDHYQRQEAWTWEHQALLHARAVAGAPELCAAFERIRLEVLADHIRRQTLRSDVAAMRERMRRELSKSGPGRFDLKQDPGGIADVEFLAQYWALRWARDYPPVALFSDTIRQLESVASADLVPQSTVDRLTDAYRTYRTRLHYLSVIGAPAVVDATELSPQRAAVIAVWNEAMADPGAV